MNKTTAAALLLFAAASFAGQAYIGGGAGLAFGAPGRVLGQDGDENLYGSYGGDALNLGIHAGLRASGGVGGEIGLEWQNGFVQTTSKQGSAKTTSELTGVWITPALTVTSRGASISPFARFGLVFGTGLNRKVEASAVLAGAQVITRTEYSGGGAWGFQGGFGVEIKAAPRAAIVLELQGRDVQWIPAERESGTTVKYDDPPSAGEARSITVDLSSMQVRLGLNYAL